MNSMCGITSRSLSSYISFPNSHSNQRSSSHWLHHATVRQTSPIHSQKYRSGPVMNTSAAKKKKLRVIEATNQHVFISWAIWHKICRFFHCRNQTLLQAVTQYVQSAALISQHRANQPAELDVQFHFFVSFELLNREFKCQKRVVCLKKQ